MNRYDSEFARLLGDADFFRTAVNFTAQRTAFAARLIEKDFFCSIMLEFLASASDALVFKGGTCLAARILIRPPHRGHSKTSAERPVRQFFVESRRPPETWSVVPEQVALERNGVDSGIVHRGINQDTSLGRFFGDPN